MSASTITTRQGDTWDRLAHRLWGVETMQHHLLAANPSQAHLAELPADLVLIAPDVQPAPQEEAPPWQIR